MEPMGLRLAHAGRAQACDPPAPRRHKPRWRRLPLRLLSSRAVSCKRLRSVAPKRLIASALPPPALEIRF
jgi:hypothetical protein